MNTELADKLEKLLEKATPGPWGACNKGKCTCRQIWSEPADHPVATVVGGKWGDDYPTIKPVEGATCIGMQVEAVMEQITYGEVPQEKSTANAELICALVNNAKAIIEALRKP